MFFNTVSICPFRRSLVKWIFTSCSFYSYPCHNRTLFHRVSKNHSWPPKCIYRSPKPFHHFFGYHIFSVRLLSLIAYTITLFMVYLIMKTYQVKKTWIYLTLLLLASHIQLTYMAHTARQESLILLIMVACLLLNIKKIHPIKTAHLLGISIGIHPNSLLIALGIGLVYLYFIYQKKTSLKSLVTLIGITGLWAIFFVGFSFYLNPNFASDYIAYGKSLGVFDHDIGRLKGYYYYYYKLFYQIGGTYWLFPISKDILLLLISIPFGIYCCIKKEKHAIFFLMSLGINIGYLIIGRYNQTAIVFTLFFNVLFWVFMVKQLRIKNILLLLFLMLQLHTTFQVLQIPQDSYSDLSQHFQFSGKTLANLNMEYHFQEGQLIDYRNLWHETDFEAYIRKHHIEYIVLPEEIHYIHTTSPKWDILYGPLDYYDNMMVFLETCEQVDEFVSPTYGMRISRYIGTYPWSIKIYKVPPTL